MTRRNLLLACSMLLIPALVLAAPAKKSSKGKKKKAQTTVVAGKDEKKKDSSYDKLFKGKKCVTKKGLITLHKVDSTKLYLELPVSIFEREMLLGSTVSEISNNEHGVIGYKPNDPLHVMFTKKGEGVQLCQLSTVYNAAPGDAGIAEAVKKSTIPSVYQAFKIEAYNADSSAVVIDATDLFVSNNADLTPFDPWSTYGRKPFQRTTSFEKSKSSLGDIKAFEDNVTIKSYLSYTVDVTYTNGPFRALIENKRPFTALVTRTFLLLPEEPMMPRIADPRMNIFFTGKAYFSPNMNHGTLPVYLARHWRVEPSDVEAYKRGELVEPKKPITFYVDNNFPEAWKPYIRAAILEWNAPFEAIGFKNAVQALDFPDPKDDPEFDPDNLKYSCLRYAPVSIMNAMGPSWDDPRTGEIINASVMVYNDITRLINIWRFLQTAAVDPNARQKDLPKEMMGDAMRYVIAHEIGHCLGFMHNMASSAAIPTDSLRSPSFTQKYGTTMSIMDYARFNHVAQPGDYEKGVKMTPPNMGVHDYYAVKWLYSPIFDAKTPQEEVPTLDKWIREKADDPKFRYGKQQIFNTIDPTSQTEDLGDDVVKGAEYGIKNLKVILANINKWVGESDNDLQFREFAYPMLLNQYLRFVMHAYNVKGGVMLNERKAGDPRPSYQFVDGDYQRRAQKFLAEQLKDLDWIDNNELMKELPLQGNLSIKIQRYLVALLVADKGSLGRMYDPAKNAYTIQENADMAFNAIFEKTIKGQTLSPRDMTNQISYLDFMMLISRLTRAESAGGGRGIAATEPQVMAAEFNTEFSLTPRIDDGCRHHEHCNMYEQLLPENNLLNQIDREDIMGFGWFRALTESMHPREPMYYGKVVEARNLIRKMKNTGSKETRLHYEMLLHRLDGVLE